MRNEVKDMKLLKIENKKGYFLNADGGYSEIDKINKDDLLRLLSIITAPTDETTEKIEMDTFNADNIPQKAHSIIYEELYKRLSELEANKDNFNKQVAELYKDEYEKYNLSDVYISGED